MSREAEIPVLHRAIAAAVVKAVLGDRAEIRSMQVMPAATVLQRAGALKYGIRTFWSRWTARQSNGSSTKNETPR
ncbi:MAG: hypothetical protein ABI759_27680 [Candidatus Solibacter sp.]